MPAATYASDSHGSKPGLRAPMDCAVGCITEQMIVGPQESLRRPPVAERALALLLRTAGA